MPTSAKNRRGAALLLVLLLLTAIGALATGGIFLADNAVMMSKATHRERELRYAAENGIAIARSQIARNGAAVPDTGFDTLFLKSPVYDAAGKAVPNATISAYAGPSGIVSGQFGLSATLLVEARAPNGAGFVRSLALTQESFAKYAYWSDKEKTAGGAPILFGSGDQLWGPVWSNDEIQVSSVGGATFHDDIGTAKTITGKSYGVFKRGYKEKQPEVELPDNKTLAHLPGYAASGGLSFNAPNNGDETVVRMRIEFVAADLNGDGDSTDVNEGLLRVFVADPGRQAALRGDFPNIGGGDPRDVVTQCGDWHDIEQPGGGTRREFFPASIHKQTWFRDLLDIRGGMTTAQANAERDRPLRDILAGAGARCFLAGDPHLVATERTTGPMAARQKGGTDTTFTAKGANGEWLVADPTPDPLLLARRAHDAPHLRFLYRGINTGAKGVVHVNGTVGVSGTLRSKVTLYAENGHVVVLDDLRYANDPGAGRCEDILGIISARNVTIADNAINTPQDVDPSGAVTWRSLDDTKDLFLHSVVMALQTSFRAQDYDQAPFDATNCEGKANGRGCLYLTGGIIMDTRGAVGTSLGAGYIKRYSYDRCAEKSPPPYFPTTGRFTDNEYTELDPVGFSPATYFKRVSSKP